MEKWDAYNKDFVLIEGVTLTRGEAIPQGMYHLVSDILVRHKDGTYLIMRRSPNKHYGGLWEATAGGSALKGETPLECAIRELKEETGIIAKDIKEVGREASDETHSYYVEFLCITDIDKDKVTIQEGENDAYKWVSKDELLSLKEGELITKRMFCYITELARKR